LIKKAEDATLNTFRFKPTKMKTSKIETSIAKIGKDFEIDVSVPIILLKFSEANI